MRPTPNRSTSSVSTARSTPGHDEVVEAAVVGGVGSVSGSVGGVGWVGIDGVGGRFCLHDGRFVSEAWLLLWLIQGEI